VRKITIMLAVLLLLIIAALVYSLVQGVLIVLTLIGLGGKVDLAVKAKEKG
jgi:hypothetical protein